MTHCKCEFNSSKFCFKFGFLWNLLILTHNYAWWRTNFILFCLPNLNLTGKDEKDNNSPYYAPLLQIHFKETKGNNHVHSSDETTTRQVTSLGFWYWQQMLMATTLYRWIPLTNSRSYCHHFHLPWKNWDREFLFKV